MKKIIIVGLLPLLFAGCTSSDIKMIKLQADIDKLQEQVAELHETVGIVSADDTAHAIQSDTSRISLNKEQLAIEHVEYCLKMYLPDLKHENARVVKKNDGTYDVIVDTYDDVYKRMEPTYYNVAVGGRRHV